LRNAIKRKAKDEVEYEAKIKTSEKEFNKIVQDSLEIEKKLPK